MKEYVVGDECWLVDRGLVIRCCIVEVDDYFRQQSPDAYLFYDVDEPVGHNIQIGEGYEAFETREEAFREAHSIKKLKTYHKDYYCSSLAEYREDKLRFIYSTWLNAGEEAAIEGRERLANIAQELLELPIKARGVDWFTIKDVLAWNRDILKHVADSRRD